ncbi:hypothetical protein Tco_0726748 [Tanacetum coccineum]|uniref:Uncharacterized protein n=1 Tax=Tanacetum coccineum TaxID=301880 RepID=A0ABQ4YIT3_9ASTR
MKLRIEARVNEEQNHEHERLQNLGNPRHTTKNKAHEKGRGEPPHKTIHLISPPPYAPPPAVASRISALGYTHKALFLEKDYRILNFFVISDENGSKVSFTGDLAATKPRKETTPVDEGITRKSEIGIQLKGGMEGISSLIVRDIQYQSFISGSKSFTPLSGRARIGCDAIDIIDVLTVKRIVITRRIIIVGIKEKSQNDLLKLQEGWNCHKKAHHTCCRKYPRTHLGSGQGSTLISSFSGIVLRWSSPILRELSGFTGPVSGVIANVYSSSFIITSCCRRQRHDSVWDRY